MTETHIHADFVSGTRDLVRHTGAAPLLSAEGGADWQYGFAESDGARLLQHGDAIDVGNVRLEVRHTPGHTPEHLAFLVTDRAAASNPIGMLTGDFVFVGDVGRPDLLERAANVQGTMDALARQLFRSLAALAELPDYLQLWPGHGAGSACGKALGALPSSTLGYERLVNWAFQIRDEDAFVRAVLAGQPEPPRYFALMKEINRDGPPPARLAQEMLQMDLSTYQRAVDAGAIVVDARPTREFASGHMPDALNIPNGGSFATWAGALLPYDRQLVLIAGDRGHAARARHALTLIGLDRVIGWADDSLHDEFEASGGTLLTVAQMDVHALSTDHGHVVIDVRRQNEWDEGHLPQARHYFLGDLVEHVRDLPRDTPLALHCQGGTRSAIAASLLQAEGFTDVANVTGGYKAWVEAGLPVEKS